MENQKKCKAILESAKLKLETTINNYNSSVNDISKFKFNKREVDLFCEMMVEFVDEQSNVQCCEKPIEQTFIESHYCQCKNRRTFYKDKEHNDICYDCDKPINYPNV